MLKPDRVIEKQIKAYDRGLSVRWNNKEKYWEIWYKRPSGQKLITPVVEGIYVDGGSAFKFCPLDYRILEWLYLADSKRTGKNWRWVGKKRYFDRIKRRNEKTSQLFENFAKDNYNMIQMEMINPLVDQSNWLPPDMVGSQRIMCRSGENVRELRRRYDKP